MELVAATSASLEAARQRESLQELLSCAIPDEWPPEALGDALDVFIDMAKESQDSAWNPYWWILCEGSNRTLVGNGGFLGDPAGDGFTEVGFEVQPSCQNKGFAQEAVAALVAWAFKQSEIGFIQSHCYRTNLPALRVLSNIGFVKLGEEDDLFQLAVTRDSAGKAVEAFLAAWEDETSNI